MKILKTLLGTVAGIAVFLVVCSKLNFLYVTYDPWYRILFHSYYEQESIDNVFVGSSHVYCGIDPGQLDELNGMNNFNMSNSGQRWDDSFYLLNDVLNSYDVKNVYLECYSWTLTEHEIWNKEEGKYEPMDFIDDPAGFFSPWLITYEMKPSVNSFAMLAGSSDVDHLMETIFPFVRYRANIFNWDAVRKNIDDKTGDDYRNYKYYNEKTDVDGTKWSMEYRDKGYNYSTGHLLDQEKYHLRQRDFSKYGLGKKSEKYLRKSIELCKSKGVEVKLFVAPIYELQLISTNDYDSFVDSMKAISNEYDVDFYDFNLIKPDVLDIQYGKYYMDLGHLNKDGARLYTKVVWDVLNSTPDENREKFFDSYSEKLSKADPEIYGLFYDEFDPGAYIKEDGSPVCTRKHYTVASNRDMKYRISRTISNDDGSGEEVTELIQDYDDNREFDVPADQSGKIMIEGLFEGNHYDLTVDYK